MIAEEEPVKLKMQGGKEVNKTLRNDELLPVVSAARQLMREDFRSRWVDDLDERWKEDLMIATFLDPRYKSGFRYATQAQLRGKDTERLSNG